MAKGIDVLVYRESWLRAGVDIELHHRCHEKWYCAVDTGPAPHQQRGIETGPIFPVNAIEYSCVQYHGIPQIVIGLGEVSGGLACAGRGVGCAAMCWIGKHCRRRSRAIVMEALAPSIGSTAELQP